MKKLIILVLLCAMFAGCSVVMPSHANIIDDHCGNAQAINEKIQADPDVSSAIKEWWAAEAETWQYMSDWAHGRIPEPKKTEE